MGRRERCTDAWRGGCQARGWGSTCGRATSVSCELCCAVLRWRVGRVCAGAYLCVACAVLGACGLRICRTCGTETAHGAAQRRGLVGETPQVRIAVSERRFPLDAQCRVLFQGTALSRCGFSRWRGVLRWGVSLLPCRVSSWCAMRAGSGAEAGLRAVRRAGGAEAAGAGAGARGRAGEGGGAGEAEGEGAAEGGAAPEARPGTEPLLCAYALVWYGRGLC
eukprot:1153496-Rhodomonas_salina.1